MSSYDVLRVGSGKFPAMQDAESEPSKFKTFGFAVLIIFGLGGLAVAGTGIGGLLPTGSLTNLGQVKSIIMIVIGGVGGVSLLFIGIRGVVNTCAGTKEEQPQLEESKNVSLQEEQERKDRVEVEKKAREEEAALQQKAEVEAKKVEAERKAQELETARLREEQERKDRVKAETTAAITIQSVLRKHQAQLELSQLKAIKSLTIVDARDSGMEWQDVSSAICALACRELQNDQGPWPVSSYVQERYFKSLPIEPGHCSPEFILIAKAADDIVGFIITAKREIATTTAYNPYSSALPADTGYVAYLAVDSTIKRSGIGTKLMLAAMRKTKEMGKRYITLEYIANGLGVDPNRGEAKVKFYDSFSTRFGIPMEIRRSEMITRRTHIYPYWDLKDVDFSIL